MHVEYNYCPTCSHPLESQERFGRLRPACPRCGFVYFREPKVAVSILVEDHLHRLLLARRAARPLIGSWAFPGGFMDYDEEPRVAAQREAQEETGLRVEIDEVLDIESLGGEGSRQGIVIFFKGRPLGGSLRPGDDVSEVRWFDAGDVPLDEVALPGTRRLLQEWCRTVHHLDAKDSLG
jgi:ADP-ribose pyrophosphatase YjhB (NUDIX family)